METLCEEHPLPTTREPCNPVLALNDAFDQVNNGRLVNETAIETWLHRLQAKVSVKDPCFWLLMARLTELTTICAGRYADACEFAAAGDLLVNPREIRVHVRDDKPQTLVKHRRGALSIQLAVARKPKQDFIQWFRHRAKVEIVKKPLLPFFVEMLEGSGIFSCIYLYKLHVRLERIAETIGFLSSGQITDAADLHIRLGLADPRTRRFIKSHLCQFNLNLYTALGQEVRDLASGGAVGNAFLDPAVIQGRPREWKRYYRNV